MKLHKLISRTVLATVLLGATIGGSVVGINNVNAGIDDHNQPAPNTQGNATQPNLNNKTKGSSYNGGGTAQTYKTNTNVRDGYLTLDSVPTFNFGQDKGSQSNDAGQPITLHLNSNNDGVLRITDYRNIDKNSYGSDPNQYQGWQLNVKMNQFGNTSNYNGDNGNGLNQRDWTMHLNNNGNYNNLDYNNNSSGEASKAVFNNQSISANNQNDGYMLDSTKQGSAASNSNGIGKGYGVNQITYNNSNDATLDIPNVPSGTYTADMTWTLSTPLNSYNTNSDNGS